MKDTGKTINGVKVYSDPECPPGMLFMGNFTTRHPRRSGKLTVLKLKYRDFSIMGKTIIRALRKNPNAVIVYPTGFNIDDCITYLEQHGYPANPVLDKNAQYFMDKDIAAINSSNVLMSRILKQPQSWDIS